MAAEFDMDAMRQRLEETLDKSKRSMRDVSLAIGSNPTYVHGILKRNQVPSVDKLEKICKELNVSMLWVMYGLDAPPGAEEVFQAMRDHPDRFWAMMKLL